MWYLIEQMSYAVTIDDFTKALVISRKVTEKTLKELKDSNHTELYQKFYTVLLKVLFEIADYKRIEECSLKLSEICKNEDRAVYLVQAALYQILSAETSANDAELKSMLSSFNKHDVLFRLLLLFTSYDILDADEILSSVKSIISKVPLISSNDKYANREAEAFRQAVIKHVFHLIFYLVEFKYYIFILCKDTFD